MSFIWEFSKHILTKKPALFWLAVETVRAENLALPAQFCLFLFFFSFFLSFNSFNSFNSLEENKPKNSTNNANFSDISISGLSDRSNIELNSVVL